MSDLMRRFRLLLVICGVLTVGLTALSQSPQPDANQRLLQGYRPVTDAMLAESRSGDWLHFRRTLDEQGYSPLDQINRQNVHQLQLAWSWTAPSRHE